ncbi:MAG: toll/interleukin-1 receptor domain-containing protein [Endomicrobium sp.]|uniref:toll/interleukin-1 receptor domain-containing protein n=1 Tax=Candidatus Endomicrobiellum pyrsonymphae TaxID=1408203 RepID=UPI00357298B5|nr:toll/interleukin-1 receptor domain-containing protein [Endomicrobium sp.]
MNEEKINLRPKVFISYSRGTEQHEDRVLKLARELVENGIDVKIDKWDIQPGQNLHKFMEEMVNNNDINKVLVICNKLYADKANDRKGGVGIETDIIKLQKYMVILRIQNSSLLCLRKMRMEMLIYLHILNLTIT